MENRLCYAIKHKYEAYSGIKKHCQPSPGAKLGFGIFSAQPNVCKPAKSKVNAEEQNDVYSKHIKPPKVGGNVRLYRFKKIPNGFLKNNS